MIEGIVLDYFALKMFNWMTGRGIMEKTGDVHVILERIGIRGMSRQQVAFLEECRKIKGCVSLREDFYTEFIPIFSGFGAVHGGNVRVRNSVNDVFIL